MQTLRLLLPLLLFLVRPPQKAGHVALPVREVVLCEVLQEGRQSRVGSADEDAAVKGVVP